MSAKPFGDQNDRGGAKKTVKYKHRKQNWSLKNTSVLKI